MTPQLTLRAISFCILLQENLSFWRIMFKKGDEVMEQVIDQKWICSKCNCEIIDEAEYIDNHGVCDDCYSIPLKKRIGKLR